MITSLLTQNGDWVHTIRNLYLFSSVIFPVHFSVLFYSWLFIKSKSFILHYSWELFFFFLFVLLFVVVVFWLLTHSLVQGFSTPFFTFCNHCFSSILTVENNVSPSKSSLLFSTLRSNPISYFMDDNDED